MKEGAQLLNYIATGCLDENLDNSGRKGPLSEAGEFSLPTLDNAITTYVRMLIENIPHIF